MCNSKKKAEPSSNSWKVAAKSGKGDGTKTKKSSTKKKSKSKLSDDAKSRQQEQRAAVEEERRRLREELINSFLKVFNPVFFHFLSIDSFRSNIFLYYQYFPLYPNSSFQSHLRLRFVSLHLQFNEIIMR